MIFHRYARHFDRCPIWVWPWLWLQLFRIVEFTRRTGRKVLFDVSPNGRVKIRYVADPPQPEGDAPAPPPRLPRWQRWAAQSDRPEHTMPEGHGPRRRPGPMARTRARQTPRHLSTEASLRWHRRS